MRVLIINASPVKKGATGGMIEIIKDCAPAGFQAEDICIDDYELHFCRGCKECYRAGVCVYDDGVSAIIDRLRQADRIVIVAPSYWAELPGQFKVFIDRCTPYGDTNENRSTILEGKRGYAVALRTGGGMAECTRLTGSIEHFYGHMGIERCGSVGFCGIAGRADLPKAEDELRRFCRDAIYKAE